VKVAVIVKFDPNCGVAPLTETMGLGASNGRVWTLAGAAASTVWEG